MKIFTKEEPPVVTKLRKRYWAEKDNVKLEMDFAGAIALYKDEKFLHVHHQYLPEGVLRPEIEQFIRDFVKAVNELPEEESKWTS